MGALARKVPLRFAYLHGGNNRLRTPLGIFIFWCLLSCGIAFAQTGSVTVAGIGLIAYLSPLPAILLAIVYARSANAAITFLQHYLWMSVLFVSTVYLAYLGFEWRILDSVGPGLWIYPDTGPAVKLPNGLFRAPEVAAWHGAAAFCFLVILANTQKGKAYKIIGGALLLVLFGAILLTGRRKALMEIMIFVVAYGFFLAWFQHGSARLARILLIMGFCALAVMSYFDLFADNATEGFEPYVQRGVSVGGDALQRLKQMTVDSLRWVIAQNGFFGSGAGTGSQGAQHFGAGSAVVGGAAEGGIGKVLAEMGVPGVALLIWLGGAFALHLRRILYFVGRRDLQLSSLACGLVAFLFANAVVFVTAHQVFGDVFVLLILGWSLGFVLAVPFIMGKRAVWVQQSGGSATRTAVLPKRYPKMSRSDTFQP